MYIEEQIFTTDKDFTLNDFINLRRSTYKKVNFSDLNNKVIKFIFINYKHDEMFFLTDEYIYSMHYNIHLTKSFHFAEIETEAQLEQILNERIIATKEERTVVTRDSKILITYDLVAKTKYKNFHFIYVCNDACCTDLDMRFQRATIIKNQNSKKQNQIER